MSRRKKMETATDDCTAIVFVFDCFCDISFPVVAFCNDRGTKY